MSHAYTRCCDGNHGRVTLFLVVVMIVVVDVSATLVIIVIMIVVSLMTISVVGVVFTAAFVSITPATNSSKATFRERDHVQHA